MGRNTTLTPRAERDHITIPGVVSLQLFVKSKYCAKFANKAGPCKNISTKKKSRFVSSLLFEVATSKASTCDESCSN